MKAAFEAPRTTEEFEQRANQITTTAAKAMLTALQNKRRLAVQEIDTEILFYEKVLAHKEQGSE